MVSSPKRILGFLVALLLVSTTAYAQSPEIVDSQKEALPQNLPIVTDNPELNKEIEEGLVKVEILDDSAAQHIDDQLRSLGYPQEFIDSTPLGLKKGRAQFGIPFSEHDQESTNTVQGESVGLMSLDPDYIDWRYDVQNLDWDPRFAGKNVFQLHSQWTWNRMPLHNMTDKLAWSWAGTDQFFYMSNSIVNEAYFFGYSDTGDTSKTKTIVVYNPRTIDGKEGSGIGTEVKLMSTFTYSGTTYHVTDMYGFGVIKVARTRTNTGASRDFSTSSSYFHKQSFLGDGTLQFTLGSLQIGISTPERYDASSQPTFLESYVD